MYKAKVLAKAILRDLEKTVGDNIYDGVAGLQAEGYLDSYRAQEELEYKNLADKKYINDIELSKMLMALDCDLYGVNKKYADKLIDYIEQHNFDVVDELKIEIQNKKMTYAEMLEEIETVKIKDYLSPIDYKRAILHKIELAKNYKKKIDFLSDIAKTIVDFGETEIEVPYSNKQYTDFSFNMTNQNHGFDSARLK